MVNEAIIKQVGDKAAERALKKFNGSVHANEAIDAMRKSRYGDEISNRALGLTIGGSLPIVGPITALAGNHIGRTSAEKALRRDAVGRIHRSGAVTARDVAVNRYAHASRKLAEIDHQVKHGSTAGAAVSNMGNAALARAANAIPTVGGATLGLVAGALTGSPDIASATGFSGALLGNYYGNKLEARMYDKNRKHRKYSILTAMQRSHYKKEMRKAEDDINLLDRFK